MISILTINYNNANGLERTIASVLEQVEVDYELIVIDGGSNDGSVSVIEKYQEHISYWVSEPDSGVYHAMNKAIAKATREFVYFLNSGDKLYAPDVLAKVTKAIHTEKDIYYGNIVQDYPGKEIIRTTPETLTFEFFHRRTIPHQASFIRKSLFDRFGGYNEKLRIVADWEFFALAICKHGVPYQYIDINIALYDTSGLSSIAANKALFKEEKLKSLQQHFPLFYEDYKELATMRRYFGLKRFKMLAQLEDSSVAQKLNSSWLSFLCFFVGSTKQNPKNK